MLVIEPCMIGSDAETTALQTGCGVFHFRTAITVDNAGFSTLFLNKTNQLIERFEFFNQGVTNIWAIKAADLHQRIVERQQTLNIIPRCIVGGRG